MLICSNMPVNECTVHCFACPADKCTHHCKGWRCGSAALCQVTRDTFILLVDFMLLDDAQIPRVELSIFLCRHISYGGCLITIRQSDRHQRSFWNVTTCHCHRWRNPNYTRCCDLQYQILTRQPIRAWFSPSSLSPLHCLLPTSPMTTTFTGYT